MVLSNKILQNFSRFLVANVITFSISYCQNNFKPNDLELGFSGNFQCIYRETLNSVFRLHIKKNKSTYFLWYLTPIKCAAKN